jgi:hypothetical protein
MSDKKTKKTFSEYYSDPLYRKQHLAKFGAKTTCECGSVVAKYNLSNHKKTKKHIKLTKPAIKAIDTKNT